MKCDKCSNYQVSISGENTGHYSACKEISYTLAVINPLTKEEKQSVMDGIKNNCRGYEK